MTNPKNASVRPNKSGNSGTTYLKFLVDGGLRERFKQTCKDEGTSMREVLTNFMQQYTQPLPEGTTADDYDSLKQDLPEHLHHLLRHL